ncbi:MAG: (d)CMP kinase [Bacteroidaceae bacterium]|nr:(d)CMP kinase [Bacteroidaceae bacterium]
MKRITIAIDGHSSCGKSTMAKDLAREIGYIYIDSGAMYRCCTLFCIEQGLVRADGSIDAEGLEARMGEIHVSFRLNAETGRPDAYLNGVNVEQRIRTMEVSSHVSPVAALPFVRAAMTAQQQAMGREGGIVMDGRDIGTAVFPDAELKIFVTASDEIRAQRRYDELIGKGEAADFDEVLANLRERDRIDSTRAVAPLRQAEDALVLDNSHLTIAEQKQWLLEQYHRLTDEYVH